MSAVTTTTARVALRRLRTAAVVAALACAANGAHASFASVVINGFTVTSDADPFTTFIFAPFETQNQSWVLIAQDGAGPIALNTGGVPDWSNVTQSAVRPNSQANVASSTNTDPAGFVTPLFTLSANATPTSGSVNNATGNMITSGSFCLWGGTFPFDGTTADCTGSGSLTFTLFYDLIISATPGGLGSSAYAELDVLGTGVPNGIFFDIASTQFGDTSALNQSFTWTANLAAGQSASFDLAGIVVAQAVPEPGVLSLAALGLVGLALTRRRNARAVS